MGRPRRRYAAALVAASLLVAACGDDDASSATDDTTIDDTATEGTVTDDATTDTSAESPGTTGGHQEGKGTRSDDEDAATAATAGADEVIELTLSEGTVDNGGRHEVSVGDTVALVVHSDVADEIHVHGYDQVADVAPGETTTMLIDATLPGVWEVELHDQGTVLLELAIS